MEFISEKYSKIKILVLKSFKMSNFDAFFNPSSTIVGYVYIEESFDTIFNMGYGEGGGYRAPPHGLCVGKTTHGLKG